MWDISNQRQYHNKALEYDMKSKQSQSHILFSCYQSYQLWREDMGGSVQVAIACAYIWFMNTIIKMLIFDLAYD